jgi:hypothetical protein
MVTIDFSNYKKLDEYERRKKDLGIFIDKF